MLGFGTCLLVLAGCSEDNKETRNSNLPKVRDNQAIIEHPNKRGYTILTDIDYQNGWDLAEKVEFGFTPGSRSRILYFKKGFGPSQSVTAKVEFVDPEFFDLFQGTEFD